MASTETVENGSTKPAEAARDLCTAMEEPPAEVNAAADNGNSNINKWPGWPGHCVFRLVVPSLKVGSILGRKGELIKKMCEETQARVRVLDGPISSPDRIVLVSGKEEPDAPLSPAMDAVMRIFKRVSGLPEINSDSKALGTAGVAFCSIRLLVASTQAINLIGKQGSLIKSIQESSGASVRVLSNEESPGYVSSEERIVELQGESLKVLKALGAVVGHLRKFLVDHSVLPLFEKKYNVPPPQEHPVEPWSNKPLQHNTSQSGGGDYSLPMKRDTSYFERMEPQIPTSHSLYGDRESRLESQISTSHSLYGDRESRLESQIPTSHSLYGDRESRLESKIPTSLSLYGQDPSVSGFRSSGYVRGGGPIVTQVAQTMQIPLTYAEDIIGVGGTNIAYIRHTSGAILTVQECGSISDEITVEIKGTSTQVQIAQQLIQEFITGHKESIANDYAKLDTGLRPSPYAHLGNSSYQPSSYLGQSYGGSYGSSGLGGGGGGGYGNYRL